MGILGKSGQETLDRTWVFCGILKLFLAQNGGKIGRILAHSVAFWLRFGQVF
jgi:hypothetical protein